MTVTSSPPRSPSTSPSTTSPPPPALPPPPLSPQRRHRFTPLEQSTIISGVQRYGVGQWKLIKQDEEFREILEKRTTVQIKDCWRTMVRRGDVSLTGGGGANGGAASAGAAATASVAAAAASAGAAAESESEDDGGEAGSGNGRGGADDRKKRTAAAVEAEAGDGKPPPPPPAPASPPSFKKRRLSLGHDRLDPDSSASSSSSRSSSSSSEEEEDSSSDEAGSDGDVGMDHMDDNDDDEIDDDEDEDEENDVAMEEDYETARSVASSAPAPAPAPFVPAAATFFVPPPPTGAPVTAPAAATATGREASGPAGPAGLAGLAADQASASASTASASASAASRIQSINSRRPPSINAVLRSVMPLQALTGVRGDELVALTNSVGRLKGRVEGVQGPGRRAEEIEVDVEERGAQGAEDGAALTAGSVEEQIGRSSSSDRAKRTRMRNIYGQKMKKRAISVLVVGLAISIQFIGISDLLHVIGGIFLIQSGAASGVSSNKTDQPPPSILARAFTPQSRRPSLRALDRTKTMATSMIASLESLLNASEPEMRHHPHIRPPRRTPTTRIQRMMRLAEPSADGKEGSSNKSYDEAELSNMTLRKFLSNDDGFHLAMAPSFFGFYAYFGALTAINEDVLPKVVPKSNDGESGGGDVGDDGEGEERIKVVLPTKANLARSGRDGNSRPEVLLKSVAGASAGAMAAVFLSSGADPRDAADTCIDLQLSDVADFGGIGAAMKGHRFEEIMRDKLSSIGGTSRFEEAVIPVAVSGFDLLSMSGKLLDGGCMARAARASATFPGLFQPVGWDGPVADSSGGGDDGSGGKLLPNQLLIDGGLADLYGLNGLSVLSPEEPKRVVNLVVGGFGIQRPPGPSSMPPGVKATEVVSISIVNTPKCGPWAMENGPKAVEAARKAVAAVLDAPMHMGKEEGHYELHIDASAFA